MKGLLPHDERRTRQGFGMSGFPVDGQTEEGESRQDSGGSERYITETNQSGLRMGRLRVEAFHWDV